MSENVFYFIVILLLISGFCSVFAVIRIAKDRNYDLKRWTFYAIYLNVFALIYLLVKRDRQENSITSNSEKDIDLDNR